MYITGYPLTWFLLLLTISIISYYFKYTKITILSLIVLIVFALSLTRNGSSIWLNSISVITKVSTLQCKKDHSESAILLPGGVVYLRSGKRVMTSWSELRVNAISEDINKGVITYLYIPGGSHSGKTNEGLRLKSEIIKRIKIDIKIEVGEGSDSTFENFRELLPLIDKNKRYALYTSDWHMYRAFKVAKKMNINICPIIIKHTEKELDYTASLWKLKAAIREYIAIIWYAIKGRI